MLTAAGAWLITAAARGVAALLLIFLWLAALQLCGRLPRRGLAVRRREAPRPPGTYIGFRARRGLSGR